MGPVSKSVQSLVAALDPKSPFESAMQPGIRAMALAIRKVQRTNAGRQGNDKFCRAPRPLRRQATETNGKPHWHGLCSFDLRYGSEPTRAVDLGENLRRLYASWGTRKAETFDGFVETQPSDPTNGEMTWN